VLAARAAKRAEVACGRAIRSASVGKTTCDIRARESDKREENKRKHRHRHTTAIIKSYTLFVDLRAQSSSKSRRTRDEGRGKEVGSDETRREGDSPTTALSPSPLAWLFPLSMCSAHVLRTRSKRHTCHTHPCFLIPRSPLEHVCAYTRSCFLARVCLPVVQTPPIVPPPRPT
jgi:hypothetical protein